ncbi:MAG: hypothetical protein ACLQFR_05440 [Streptosporangiaceae bacterium]
MAAPRSWATGAETAGNGAPAGNSWSTGPLPIAPDAIRQHAAPAPTRYDDPARGGPAAAALPDPGIARLAALGLAAAELAEPPQPARGAEEEHVGKKAGRKARGRKADRAATSPTPGQRAVRGRNRAKAVGPALASGAPAANAAARNAPAASARAGDTIMRVAVTSVAPRPASSAPARPAAPATRAARGRAVKKRRRTLRRSLAIGVGIAVVAAGAAGYDLLRRTGPAHTVTAPSRLLDYALVPALAKGMNAQALRTEIVKAGHGEASNVVDGVYEDRSSPAAKGGPVIILFVGGHLSGSASSFISSFTGLLPGAFVTSPGPMAGQAACVPAYSGHLAECAWADNDTFGFLASPALGASALSAQLRQIRPLVEHTVK